jgi:hypothetical protein
MDMKTIKDELWQIAKAYPTVNGLMCKTLPNGSTVGNQWAKVMHSSNLDAVHFENVCYEYANMERPLPQPADQLAFDIISEVKDRKWRDDQRLEQFEKYHKRKKMPWRDGDTDRWCFAMRMAIDPACKMTKEQAAELAAWGAKDGPMPEWVDVEAGQIG